MRHSKPPHLDTSALVCLEYVLHHRVYLRSAVIQAQCSKAALRRLESMGLVEQVHDICVPLEMARLYYRVTPAGKTALEQSKAQYIESSERSKKQ